MIMQDSLLQCDQLNKISNTKGITGMAIHGTALIRAKRIDAKFQFIWT